MRWLPGLHTLRRYEAAWLRHDIVAGLVLTTMLVPVGIAYAVASGVPGIYGLYATIVPLLAYALFGPSRILVLGPDSSLAAVILAVILPLSGGDPMRAVALAGMMAIVSGVVCILAGLARLGFVTELLSKPIRYGYMNGIALTVLISQLPKLFGFSIEGSGPLEDIWAIVDGDAGRDGATGSTLAVGAATLALILLLKGCKRVPGILIAVVGATIAVGVLDLASARRRVGARLRCRRACLPFTIPWITCRRYRPGADRRRSPSRWSPSPTPACCRAPMLRGPGPMSIPNQEMVGLGAANLAAGFFQGFPISSSSSRTPVAEAAGARTQLTGVVGALAVALLLVVAPDLLQNLPNTALAAVVIASAIGLIEIADLRRIYPHPALGILAVDRLLRGRGGAGRDPGHRSGDRDCRDRVPVGWLAPALGGAGPGRGRQGLPRHHALSRCPPDSRPGAVPLGCAPVLRQCRAVPRRASWTRWLTSPTPVRWLVVAAEPVTSVDVTAADMLAELDEALHAAGIELCFAEMKDPVKDKLKRFGLFSRLGEETFFPTVGAAVSSYLKTHPVDWVDWEDRRP